jgi:outer membrane protein assembly factor BamD
VLAGIVIGCGGGGKEDPILRLAADESLEQGKALMEKGKYTLAREYLTHAFEVEPNSASGREALLLVADAHYLQGGNQNYIRAEARYRDFQNRFPTSERADYVQFQIADSLAQRMLGPDRDQSITRKALLAYEDVVRLFPSTEYVAVAKEKIAEVRQTLAESEFLVGRFNLKLGLIKAAIARFEYLLESYPDYDGLDKVYFFLAKAYAKAGREEEALKITERLRSEFPESEYVEKISEGKGKR